jgi:hypothetical protein
MTTFMNNYTTELNFDSWEDRDQEEEEYNENPDQEYGQFQEQYQDQDQDQEYEQLFQQYERPDSDNESGDDDDEDYNFSLKNNHREFNQSEIDMYNISKKEHQPIQKIEYDLSETPDAPWKSTVSATKIQRCWRKHYYGLQTSILDKKIVKRKNKPCIWDKDGSKSLFTEVVKHQEKIRKEKLLVRDAVNTEKLLIKKRGLDNRNNYRSVACKFGWDKYKSKFNCKCRNTDQKHRNMYAHRHADVRPPVCKYDRLCKNEKCLRMHTMLFLSVCKCGENDSARYYDIVCSCPRRFETPKEYRQRTGFNYTGNPNEKLRGNYIFTPVKSPEVKTLAEIMRVPSNIMARKKQKYEEYQTRIKNKPVIRSSVQFSTLKKKVFTPYWKSTTVDGKGGKVKSVLSFKHPSRNGVKAKIVTPEEKAENKRLKESVKVEETEANKNIRKEREIRIKNIEDKRRQQLIKEEHIQNMNMFEEVEYYEEEDYEEEDYE